MSTTAFKLSYLKNTVDQFEDKSADLFGEDFIKNATFRELANEYKNLWTDWPNKVTAEGTSIELNNIKKGKIQIQPMGNTIQEDDSQEIKNVTSNNKVIIEGKNWAGIERGAYDNPHSEQGLTFTYNKNIVTVTGTREGTAVGESFLFKKFFMAGTYTISGLPNKEHGNYDRGTVYIWYDKTPNLRLNNANETITGVYSQKTITLTQDGYIGFRINCASTSGETDVPPYNQTYNIQIEKGENITNYEPYIEPIEKELNLTSKNLFNKNTITKGKYISHTGQTLSHANLCISSRINVQPGDVYTLSGLEYMSPYQWNVSYWTDNTFIIRDAQTTLTYTFTIPENCNNIILSLWNNDLSNVQLEKNITVTEYEPYYNYNLLKDDYIAEDCIIHHQETTEIIPENTILYSQVKELYRTIIPEQTIVIETESEEENAPLIIAATALGKESNE